MKKSEDRLDRWLKGLFADAAFSTGEEDWQAISTRLDKRKKRRSLWIPVALLAVFFSALGMLLFRSEPKTAQLSQLQKDQAAGRAGQVSSPFHDQRSGTQNENRIQEQNNFNGTPQKPDTRSKPFNAASKKYQRAAADNAILYHQYKQEKKKLKQEWLHPENKGEENKEEGAKSEERTNGMEVGSKILQLAKADERNDSSLKLKELIIVLQKEDGQKKEKKKLSSLFSASAVSIEACLTGSRISGSVVPVSVGDARIHENYFDLRKQDKPAYGRGAGFGISYALSRHFHLQSGLIYVVQTQQIDYRFKNNDIPVVDSATGKILGYIKLPDNVAEEHYTGTNKQTEFIIPVSLSAEFNISPALGLGVKGSMLIRWNTVENSDRINPTDLSLERSAAKASTYQRDFSITPIALWHFQRGWAIFGEFPISIPFTKQTTDNFIKTDSRSLTLNLGVRFSPFLTNSKTN